jgi:hypothetical protein
MVPGHRTAFEEGDLASRYEIAGAGEPRVDPLHIGPEWQFPVKVRGIC